MIYPVSVGLSQEEFGEMFVTAHQLLKNDTAEMQLDPPSWSHSSKNMPLSNANVTTLTEVFVCTGATHISYGAFSPKI